jgi:hypothetical protein
MNGSSKKASLERNSITWSKLPEQPRRRTEPNHEEKPILIKLPAEKTVSEVAAALQIAVQANPFGLMQVHNLKETMAKKGVEFAAQQAQYRRAKCNRAARRGDYNTAKDVHYAHGSR